MFTERVREFTGSKGGKGMKRLLILLSVLLLAGCGTGDSSQTKQTTITLVHSQGTTEQSHEAMRRIYEDFELENPDIKLNLISMPSSGKVEDKVLEMLAVGKVPDLIYAPGKEMDTLYSLMVKQGYALNLMPYVEADNEFKKAVDPGMIHSLQTKEGSLYVLADIRNMSGYWYNVSVFENAGITEIPRTWKEFKEACRKINAWAEERDLDIVPLNMDARTTEYLMEAYLTGTYGSMRTGNMNISKEMLADAEEHIRAVGRMSETKNADFTYRDNIRSFNIGRSAMYVGGICDEMLLNENIEIACAPFPSESGEGVVLSSLCPGYLAGNTGDDSEKEASVRFLKYMMSRKVQERILKEAGWLPSNPEVDIRLMETKRKRFYKAWKIMSRCKISGQIPENGWTHK